MCSVACRGAQACGQVLADASVRPSQLIQGWLASLAEHPACYDNQVVSDGLKGGEHVNALFLWPFYVFIPIAQFWLALGECSWPVLLVVVGCPMALQPAQLSLSAAPPRQGRPAVISLSDTRS